MAIKKHTASKAAPLPAEAKITLLAKTSPKRKGSAGAKRFAKYKTGQTVAQALEAGLWRADIRWDSERGYISVAAPKGTPGLKRLKAKSGAEKIRRSVLADQKKALAEAGAR
jgi:hypothetical protein